MHANSGILPVIGIYAFGRCSIVDICVPLYTYMKVSFLAIIKLH